MPSGAGTTRLPSCFAAEDRLRTRRQDVVDLGRAHDRDSCVVRVSVSCPSRGPWPHRARASQIPPQSQQRPAQAATSRDITALTQEVAALRDQVAQLCREPSDGELNARRVVPPGIHARPASVRRVTVCVKLCRMAELEAPPPPVSGRARGAMRRRDDPRVPLGIVNPKSESGAVRSRPSRCSHRRPGVPPRQEFCSP